MDYRPYADLHQSFNGPGDDRPTALRILEDNDLLGKLTDKTILVTGATAALGQETVRQLAKTGAEVWFTARDEAKADAVMIALREEAKSDSSLAGAKVDWLKVENGSLESVEQCAQEFMKRSKRLNVLICNAGTSLKPFARTKDGFEEQFGVNHLAHFYFFQLLKTLLLQSSTPSFNSRVIAVTSGAHAFSTVQLGNYALDDAPKESYSPICEMEGDHNPMILYGSSKTANIWFCNEIDRRYGSQGLHALSVNPGNVSTADLTTFDPRVQEKLVVLATDKSLAKTRKSVGQGAATQVLAAVGKGFEGVGGIYLDDCGVSVPLDEGVQFGVNGYKSWIYNPEGEKRLWKDSLEMIGLKDEL